MHEYAYYGRGNTIHSPGQIEWFQNTYGDKSFHVGWKQVINFLDGYSTPLQCRTGLMYMGNTTVILVTYLGTLTRELRNLQEQETMWMMGR